MPLIRPSDIRVRAPSRGAVLVLPILAFVVALASGVWQGEAGVQQAKSAVRAGAEYYAVGGSNDLTARAVALKAWASAPSDAEVSITRACYCAGEQADCSRPCPAEHKRTVYVTLAASGTGQGLLGMGRQSQVEVLRVE